MPKSVLQKSMAGISRPQASPEQVFKGLSKVISVLLPSKNAVTKGKGGASHHLCCSAVVKTTCPRKARQVFGLPLPGRFKPTFPNCHGSTPTTRLQVTLGGESISTFLGQAVGLRRKDDEIPTTLCEEKGMLGLWGIAPFLSSLMSVYLDKVWHLDLGRGSDNFGSESDRHLMNKGSSPTDSYPVQPSNLSP